MKRFLLSYLLIVPSAWIALEFLSPVEGSALKFLMNINPTIVALLFVFATASFCIVGISFSNFLDSLDNMEKVLLFSALTFFTAVMLPILTVRWEVMLYPDKLALVIICMGLLVSIFAFLMRILFLAMIYTLGYALDKLDSKMQQ